MRALLVATVLLGGASALAQTTSRKDTSGTPGNWPACQGNGLSVCAELISDPGYWKRHPACRPKKGCTDGNYMPCNARCPVPQMNPGDPEVFKPESPQGELKPVGASEMKPETRLAAFAAWDDAVRKLKGLTPAKASEQLKKFVRQHPVFQEAGVDEGVLWARFKDGSVVRGPVLVDL